MEDLKICRSPHQTLNTSNSYLKNLGYRIILKRKGYFRKHRKYPFLCFIQRLFILILFAYHFHELFEIIETAADEIVEYRFFELILGNRNHQAAVT